MSYFTAFRALLTEQLYFDITKVCMQSDSLRDDERVQLINYSRIR